jgi:hypothetical protein
MDYVTLTTPQRKALRKHLNIRGNLRKLELSTSLHANTIKRAAFGLPVELRTIEILKIQLLTNENTNR